VQVAFFARLWPTRAHQGRLPRRRHVLCP
jgi:hypothetical protein